MDSFLDVLFEQSEVGITVVDRDLRYVRANDAFAVLQGRNPNEIVGKTIAEALPDTADQIVPGTLCVLETGKPIAHEELIAGTAGGPDARWLRAIRYPVLSRAGSVVGVTSLLIDISDLKRVKPELDNAQRLRDAAERAARPAQVDMLARYQTIFEGASIGILRVDPRGHMIEANPAMERMLGYTAAELAEMNFAQYTHPDDLPHNLVLFTELIEGKRDSFQLEKRCFRKDGELIWTQVTAALQRDIDGNPAFAISMFENITERKTAQDTMLEQAKLNEHKALHDALTGLANRRKLYLDIEEYLAAERPFVLAIFDLDGFKAYNDTFGHPAGDALLARLGSRLAAALDGRGSAYRMGGDEFCIVSDLTEGSAVVDDARSALCDKGEAFAVRCSSGLALVPSEATSLERALQLADERLYADKRQPTQADHLQVRDALVQLIVEQDAELATHATSVAELAAATATKLGLSIEDVARTRIAAELHDIGKSAIPESILAKPGPLDESEWAFIKRHTLIGERILAAAPALAQIAPIVRSSHERQDGAGYPDGLRACEIPLAARIVAVVDAFDAMTTNRPYKSAVSSAEGLAELHRCAGTQFDPTVVAAFISVIELGTRGARRPVLVPRGVHLSA